MCTKSYKKSNLLEKLKRNKSAVFSLAVLSFIANIYIIFLAGTAVGYWRHRGEDELRKLFHKYFDKFEYSNSIPLGFALAIDILCFIVWIGLVFKSASVYTRTNPLHILKDILNWFCCHILLSYLRANVYCEIS